MSLMQASRRVSGRTTRTFHINPCQTTYPHAITLVVALFAIGLSACQSVYGRVLTGEVVGITDGDTLTLLVDNTQHRIRLAGIDTPESGQPWGSRAEQALAGLTFRQTVRVEVIDTDRYGRLVGRVYVDGVYVNKRLVRTGNAWVYRRYAKDRSLYDAEEKARAEGAGLWSLPEAQRTPPWEWRHR